MRTGVLADVHGNLTALDAVLADGELMRVDDWISLGDVVGYGPDAHACVRRLRERGIPSVMGNHEARLAGLPTPRFNDVAEAAIEHARIDLDEQDFDLLRGFPDRIEWEDEALFCHGSPDDRDAYVLDAAQLRAVYDTQRFPLIFFGHTHQQLVFDGDSGWTGPGRIDLDGHARLLVNPGSVGQPRDGDPRAAYVVWDRAARSLYLRRVVYDVPSQMQRTLDAGLPEPLAHRLEVGR